MHHQVTDPSADDDGRDPDTSELLREILDDETDDSCLSDDDLFEVLYNRRRRDIITYLREGDGSSTVSDLAEYIAAKENGIPVQQLSSHERKCVYVGLYQNHLPMMDNVGVVDYDKHRGTVELRDVAEQFEPYLGEPDPTNRSGVRIVAAILLSVTVLLGVLDVGVFSAGSDLMWLALGVGGCVWLAAFDAYGRSVRHAVRSQFYG